MTKQKVIELFGPENELQKIVYGNQSNKVYKALMFLMKESNNFLLLKHMIEFYHSKEEFEINLSSMVKLAMTIRRKTLKALPKQFKFWEFSKRYYARKLVKIVLKSINPQC